MTELKIFQPFPDLSQNLSTAQTRHEQSQAMSDHHLSHLDLRRAPEFAGRTHSHMAPACQWEGSMGKKAALFIMFS